MNVQTSFLGMEPSDALREYLDEKIQRHNELLIPAISISAEFIQNVKAKGVKNDFKFELNVVLPKAIVRVEERGEDMYAVVDKAIDVFLRRLKRYLDKKAHWEGVTPWSDLEALAELEDDSVDMPDNYINYVPKIAVRKQLENSMPISEAEAIERMELLGDSQILFKNTQTGKMTMIYKNIAGQYCLVEPKEEL